MLNPLVLGVVSTYLSTPEGNVPMLGLGVAAIMAAILLDAMAYQRLANSSKRTPLKGIVLSVTAGLLMGFFYKYVAQAMGKIDLSTKVLEPGKLSPYTALVLFSAGLLLSNFLWNSIVMVKPFSGAPVPLSDYFTKGNSRLHLVGILGANRIEAELLTGVAIQDEKSAARAAEILRAKGVKTVVLTLGPKGAFVATGSIIRLVPGFRVHAVDTTGAGDIFNGALAVGLGEGKPLLQAVRFANAAAALSVTRPGAQESAPTRKEIEQFLAATDPL